MNPTQHAKDDFELILNDIVPAVEVLLSKSKELYPIAMAVKADGELIAVGAQLNNEHPETQEVIDDFVNIFSHNTQYRAVAIAFMGLDKKKDVLLIDFSHKDGSGMQFQLPYKFKGFKKKLEFGAPTFSAFDKVIDLS